MKITATSQFHGSMSVTFTGCKVGVNIRRLRGPRSRYCLDYSHANTHVCGCGYPVARTAWDAGEGWEVGGVAECDQYGDMQGRGYIRFRVEDIRGREAALREANADADAALLASLNPDGTFRS